MKQSAEIKLTQEDYTLELSIQYDGDNQSPEFVLMLNHKLWREGAAMPMTVETVETLIHWIAAELSKLRTRSRQIEPFIE